MFIITNTSTRHCLNGKTIIWLKLLLYMSTFLFNNLSNTTYHIYLTWWPFATLQVVKTNKHRSTSQSVYKRYTQGKKQRNKANFVFHFANRSRDKNYSLLASTKITDNYNRHTALIIHGRIHCTDFYRHLLSN